MRWNYKPKPDPKLVQHLSEVLGVDGRISSLLVQRGVSNYSEAKEFFRPSLEALHDPFLMQDMDKAVARILKAIKQGENILVYGDYDVDGTTSVALVTSYLQEFYPNVASYIPDRYQEGYGVSIQGIDFAADNDISLIIALDCGIKAVDKVAYAAQKKIDFIICDHHRPGDVIPNAVAVLDPKRKSCGYPYKELCGCGVGFKLLQAIHLHRKMDPGTLYPYLDLVATAIAADIVPITGENRILAYHGLKAINSSPRPGIKALLSQAKTTKFNLSDVIFKVAPRINAAGRMRHGLHAVELLTEKDEFVAMSLAGEIETYNKERRTADENITLEALAQIEMRNEQDRHTTVVYEENWHKGVIGIVASRLTETYYRPTLVFTKSNKKLAASARSVKGFDVYDALESCSEYIEQFGGHKYAAGLTLLEDQYENFKRKFEEVVSTTIDKELLVPEISVDTEINLSDITPKFFRILQQFEPFGPGNPSPVFTDSNLTDTGYAKCVGETNAHLKCRLKDGDGMAFDAIGFKLGNKMELVTSRKPLRAAFSIEENVYKGKASIQLRLLDLAIQE